MNAPADLAWIMAHLPEIREAIAFARALRNLKVVTSAGEITLKIAPGSDNAVLDLAPITPTGATAANTLPPQTGQAGKILATDGATTYWAPQ